MRAISSKYRPDRRGHQALPTPTPAQTVWAGWKRTRSVKELLAKKGKFYRDFKGMRVIILRGEAAMNSSVTKFIVAECNSRNGLVLLKTFPDKMKISQEALRNLVWQGYVRVVRVVRFCRQGEQG